MTLVQKEEEDDEDGDDDKGLKDGRRLTFVQSEAIIKFNTTVTCIGYLSNSKYNFENQLILYLILNDGPKISKLKAGKKKKKKFQL